MAGAVLSALQVRISHISVLHMGKQTYPGSGRTEIPAQAAWLEEGALNHAVILQGAAGGGRKQCVNGGKSNAQGTYVNKFE